MLHQRLRIVTLDNRLKAYAIVRIVNIKLEDYVYGHALLTLVK